MKHVELQTPYGEEGELRFAYGWHNKRAFCTAVREQIAEELTFDKWEESDGIRTKHVVEPNPEELDELTEEVIPANVRHGFGCEVAEGQRWLSRHGDGFMTVARKHRWLPPFFLIHDQDGIALMMGRPITYVFDH